MVYSYNKDLDCVDVILNDGIFRKLRDGNCIVKLKNGTEDSFLLKANMTIKEYRSGYISFCEKYNIDYKEINKIFKSKENC